MATLNLRISNKKSNKNNLKTQKPSALFPSGSDTYYAAARIELSNYSNSELATKFLSAKTVEENLEILKKVSQNISNKDAENDEILTKVVMAIYLLADFQCHSKNAALKILEQPNIKMMENEINSQMLTFISNSSSRLEDEAHVAGTLLHFSKSRLSGGIIVQCWKEIISFFIKSLNDHYAHLSCSNNTAPLRQAGVFAGLQVLFQAAVAVLSVNKQVLPDLAEVLAKILSTPPSQLPSDCQNTCAIALVLVSGAQDGLSPLIWPALGKKSLKSYSTYHENLQNCDIGVQISLCAAILSCFSNDELTRVLPENIVASIEHSTLVRAIFAFLVIHTSRSTDAQILLGGCRALATLSHVFKEGVDVLGPTLLPQALEHCLFHLEHHMDSVRHTAKAFLDALLLATQPGSETEAKVISAVRSLHNDSKARFAGVSALASRFKSQVVLNEFPDLVLWLIDSSQRFNTAPHAVSTMEILMQRHLETNAEDWCKIWVQPVLEQIPNCPTLETVLAKAISLRPQTLPFVLRACDEDQTTGDSASKLKILLGCLKIAQKCMPNGPDDADGSWRGVITWDRLKFALIHSDDDLRLAAVALLVESRKPTEPFSARELEFLLIGVVTCADSHAPSTLHRAVGLAKKLLSRLGDGLRRLVKHNEETNHYPLFLTNLCTKLFAELFPGASLGRRSLSLHILTLVLELLAPIEPWTEVWISQCTSVHAQALLDCLSDTYESNKQLALNIIHVFPSNALGFNDAAKVKEMIDNCIVLSESCKPPDCMTAAYMFSVLVNNQDCCSSLQEAANSRCSSLLSTCQLLLSRVKIQLEIARTSILQAAARGPMYGTLYCLRHLLSNANLTELSQLDEGTIWRLIIDEFVDTCFQLNATVAPIVNSSSPEGHLPMDFESDVTSQLGNMEIEEKHEDIKVTAQMVLLCSWRTVKEVSLFLGELAANAPAKQESYLLSTEQLIAIGEHLTSLLCETKHRGAFEQAYVGFCRLCAWLWRVPNGELPQLPAKWLQELLSAISIDEKESAESQRLANKLCATRRSAGVPFIVQALVSTELEVRERPECFPGAMARLLELASLPGNPGQVHALNILRALFRSSRLGEHVASYVAQGFAAAFRAFAGASWAERNAATLLFSSLMGRVFGVKHTPGHEDYPRKNRMTGRIFFRLYPEVFSLLAEQLSAASELISSRNAGAQLTPSLHPTLLLLARLYPSSLEGTDTSLNLLSLRSNVIICAASPVFHTRVLAARALVPLVDPGSLPEFISLLSLTLPQSHNLLHGTLLQLSGLVEGSSESNEELCSALRNKVMEGLSILDVDHKCDITKAEYVRFVSSITTRHPLCLTSTLVENLRSKLRKILYISGDIGYSLLKQKTAQVLLRICPTPEDLLPEILQHPLPNVAHEGLIYLLLNCQTNDEICGDAQQILALKIKGHGNLQCTNDIASCLVQLALQWSPLEGQAVCIENRVALFWCICRLATHILQASWPGVDNVEGKIKLFLQMECEERLGPASFMLVAACGELILASSIKITDRIMSSYCDALLRHCEEDSSFSARLVVAQSLCRNKQQIFSASPCNVCKAHDITMTLLQDTSDIVRNAAAKLWPNLSDVTRTLAMRNLAFNLVNSLHATSPHDVLFTLLNWALGEMLVQRKQTVTCLEDNESHEVVFDKGDAALSSEQLKLTIAACEALKLLLEKSPENTIIQSLHTSMQGIKEGTSLDGKTSAEILKNLRVSSFAHFLHADYQVKHLNALQLEYLKQTGLYKFIE